MAATNAHYPDTMAAVTVGHRTIGKKIEKGLVFPPFRQREGERMGHGFGAGGRLAAEEVFGFLESDVAADVGDGVGQGNLFGTDLDAILREAALLHTAVAG